MKALQIPFSFLLTWMLVFTFSCTKHELPPACLKLTITHGNNQRAPIGQTLGEALQVQVKDQNGIPQPNIPIQWTVTSGGGSLNTSISTTNANGISQVNWTLGTLTDVQKVKANILVQLFDAHCSATTVEFTATTGAVAMADFSFSIANQGKNPTILVLTNTSKEATSYSWHFGDGTTSSEQVPLKYYTEAKTYKVKLIAKNELSADTIEKEVVIPAISLARVEKSVRVIYLIPSDRQFSQTYYDGLVYGGIDIQDWYKGQMNGKSFRFNGQMIEVLKSTQREEWFNADNGFNGTDPRFYFFYNAYHEISTLLGTDFDTEKYVYVIYVSATASKGGGAGAKGFCAMDEPDLEGLAGLRTEPISRWIGGWGHEMGHAFGLPHPDPPIDEAIMWTGYIIYPTCILLEEDKNICLQSGFFF